MSKSVHFRADAIRNRERIVAAARERFAASDGMVSLESVALAAGVGIATLYRHFPDRETLVEAVYCLELDALTEEAEHLLDVHEAFDALRKWMDRYARFVDTKRALYDALRAAFRSRATPAPQTRARLRATIAKFLSAGASDSTLRDDVEPDDVTVSLAGIMLMAKTAADQEQVRRLLDLLMDGLRPRR